MFIMFRNGCPDNFRTVYLLNNHHLLLFISNRGFPTSKGFLSSLKYAKYPVLEKGVLAHRDMLFLVLCCSISIQRKSKDDEGEGGGGEWGPLASSIPQPAPPLPVRRPI